MPDRPPASAPDETGTGRGQVRVVAVARTCHPVTTQVSMEHQTPDDHLHDHTWVPLNDLTGFDLIPNLRPVMHTFLRLQPVNRALCPRDR